MKTKRLALYCLLGLMTGCVPILSLHPLFTKEDIVFDEKLLGTWLEDVNSPEASWEFARLTEDSAANLPEELKGETGRLYRLNMSDKEGHKGSFVVCLVKLGDRRFLDVFPDVLPSGEPDIEKSKLLFNVVLLVRAHTFIRADSVGDQLKIAMTNDDEFKKLTDAEPKAVQFTLADDRTILTGSTKELQAFVTKYAEDKRLFSTELTLGRKAK